VNTFVSSSSKVKIFFNSHLYLNLSLSIPWSEILSFKDRRKQFCPEVANKTAWMIFSHLLVPFDLYWVAYVIYLSFSSTKAFSYWKEGVWESLDLNSKSTHFDILSYVIALTKPIQANIPERSP
jgi:hypothetical protein